MKRSTELREGEQSVHGRQHEPIGSWRTSETRQMSRGQRVCSREAGETSSKRGQQAAVLDIARAKLLIAPSARMLDVSLACPCSHVVQSAIGVHAKMTLKKGRSTKSVRVPQGGTLLISRVNERMPGVSERS